jgi:polyisoprenoid-binding protein YceI
MSTRTEVYRREVDVARSIASFDARAWHGAVHGTVPVLSGHVSVDGAGTPLAVSAELDLAGLDTGNGRRDKDLRGRRFFDTATHPVMRFESSSVEARDGGWDVAGTLTIARTACPLTLRVTAAGEDDPGAFVTVVSLDPRDLGVTAPRFLVRKVVTLRVTAHLLSPPR